MRAQLKQLTSDTAVYGLSSIVGRFLNFLLVPLYTNVFPASDYGIVAPVYSYMALLAIVVPLGMETAFMRFLAGGELGEKKQVFSTPFYLVAAAALLFAAAVHLAAPALAPLLQIPPAWSSIVPLCGWTIAADALCVLPFALLRMENRARSFALIRFLSIVVTVALNLWFILVLKRSIDSIFLAGIIGSLFSLVALAPLLLRTLEAAFRPGVLREMLRVGLPSVPAGIAGMIIQVIDRPIVLYMTDAKTSGIYQANYKLGIFMMIIVSMFQYAWSPFFLKNAKEPNARPLFARVLTYFLFAALCIFVALTLFIEPLVKVSIFGYHLLGTEYWSGISIVPIILLAYLWTGAAVVLNAGLLIEKKTAVMPAVMGVSALANIVCNVVLIPVAGIHGAACATLVSYVIMALLYGRVTARIYPVPYEFARLGKLALAAAVPIGLFYLASGISAVGMPMTLRFGLFLLFPILLAGTRFFEPEEFRQFRRLRDRLLAHQ